MKKEITLCDRCGEEINPSKRHIHIAKGGITARQEVFSPGRDDTVDFKVIAGDFEKESHYHVECADKIFSSRVLPAMIRDIPAVDPMNIAAVLHADPIDPKSIESIVEKAKIEGLLPEVTDAPPPLDPELFNVIRETIQVDNPPTPSGIPADIENWEPPDVASYSWSGKSHFFEGDDLVISEIEHPEGTINEANTDLIDSANEALEIDKDAPERLVKKLKAWGLVDDDFNLETP